MKEEEEEEDEEQPYGQMELDFIPRIRSPLTLCKEVTKTDRPANPVAAKSHFRHSPLPLCHLRVCFSTQTCLLTARSKVESAG